MIDNKRLRYRSPITGKAKSSLILDYSAAGLLLDLEQSEREAVFTAILRHELYGDEAVPTASPKAIGVYYAVTSALDLKAGEWLQSCERNQKNSPNSSTSSTRST